MMSAYRMSMLHLTSASKRCSHYVSALFNLTLCLASVSACGAVAYQLDDLIDLAIEKNPVLEISKAQEDAAQASVITAQSYINPELEVGAGPSRYRSGSQETKNNWGIGLSQPLEFSGVRAARQSLAETHVKVAGTARDMSRIELRNRVKTAFYDVLQRQLVLKIVEDDRNLLTQIRDRVKLRVNVGESPKYELIKADTELLAAERDYQAALVRIQEGKSYLRGLVGKEIPTVFDVQGELPTSDHLPDITTLTQYIDDSPQLQQLRAYRESAEAKLKLEEKLRNPGLTLKAGVEQDPDLTSLRFGLAIPLPLWNKREGQIAEAAAGIRQVQAVLNERELSLQRDLDAAYQRYQIAQNQVKAFESGLLSQSEAVLKTAEAAYKFGERGILEYLDAQRTYRSVRKDYLSAKFDHVSSMLEIERLVGADLLGNRKAPQ